MLSHWLFGALAVPCFLSVESATVVDHLGNYCPLVRHGSGTCPDNENIIFYLHTRLNPINGQIVDLENDNLTKSNFNAANPIKIIIHGQNGSSNLAQLVDMRKEYLTKGDYNLISVDWRVLAIGPFICYPTNIINMKHVGECVAQLILRLLDVSPDIHVIGQSLGAHTAAVAAKYLRPYLLPRITGLDPAKPLFGLIKQDGKLDASDAIFVDVVHTNVFEMGEERTSGHVDFYINGGTVQPGCGFLDPLCSHYRSYEYFTESINSVIGFFGWPCSSATLYYWGFCFSKPRTILMGDQCSSDSRGVVSIPTSSSKEFALGRQ